MSADPYVMSGGLTNPQGWNRYAYVAGDPVNLRDRSGLSSEGPEEEQPLCYIGSDPVFSGESYKCVDPGWIDGKKKTPPDHIKKERDKKEAKEAAIIAANSLSTDKKVCDAMVKAWNQTGNGTTGSEAGFRLDGDRSEYNIIENAYTNEQGKQSLTITSSTFAIFHVHPNASGPQPSSPATSLNGVGDTGVADKYGLDVFVISSSGLWYYDHTLKESIQLTTSLGGWLKSCTH